MGSSSTIMRIPEEAREFVRADESASLSVVAITDFLLLNL